MSDGFVKDERDRLDSMGKVFFTEKAMTIDREQMLMVVAESIGYVTGPDVVELGYTDRGWTDTLLERGFNVTTVEGSTENIEYAKKKYGSRLNIRHSLFEEFTSDKRYDSVVMSCVLEHVYDPVVVLKQYKGLLKQDGRIVIIVPNKMSLHRRVGYQLGMIKTYEELAPSDLEVGHRRHYFIDDMLDDIKRAGLTGSFEKGIFLKPLSSDRMKDWPKELLWAFNHMGRLLPEWSAFLLFIARA
ncbi:class I SAM-dependent methyltransferase [Candidatus Magnetominusculus xianensis]|uniref:SAM-dependent methyltransferase n=1 Tax=Candidatus Magnetominusculus xianensis TaxID=1748249 RepID=A0ABR5SIY4_9BACT|nr:methyltransferase domain-containing protein [Candidatus Magnetominusculus xianensis]KWT85310.1 SAM-dependent methyltransferase [Candidatus Magnetominusculus xianensis]MBF0404821.1 class I SAM-dependent methyltransferase [Nitrospirota bacterium]